MKALAAAEPLSLQVHPTAQRARAGFAREDAAGHPVGRRPPQLPGRVAQAGADRRGHQVRGDGRASATSPSPPRSCGMLDLPWADAVADELTAGEPVEALRAVVTEMLAMPAARVGGPAPSRSRDAARRAEEQGHRHRPPSSRGAPRARQRRAGGDPRLRPDARAGRALPARPGRAGDAAAQPRRSSGPARRCSSTPASCTPTRRASAIEIMAASDNVVRAGLTPKHVDVPELLEIADFRPAAGAGLGADRGRTVGPRLRPAGGRVQPPRRRRARGPRPAGGRPVHRAGPRGRGHGHDGPGRGRSWPQGSAVFVGHDEGPIEISGAGRVAIGAVPAGSG